MAMTSIDIQNQSFSIARKGYDVDEVDVFLEQVASELDEMNSYIDRLEHDLEGDAFAGFDRPAHTAPADTDEIAAKDARIEELEHQLEERKADGNAIAQALIIAQRSSDEIIAAATAEARRIVEEAEREAKRIIDDANDRKESIVESIRNLEDDRDDVREEYQDILKNFIESASKKLVEISGTVSFPSVMSAHAAPSFTATDSQLPLREETASQPVVASEYTVPPAAAAAVATPVTPAPAFVEKDLSGFGDTDDDFEFEEID